MKKGSISLHSRTFTVFSFGAFPWASEERLLRLRHDRAREVVLKDRVVPGWHGPVQEWQDVAKDVGRVGGAQDDSGAVDSKEIELTDSTAFSFSRYSIWASGPLWLLHPGRISNLCAADCD
jgi:hypothetical protein